MAAAAAAAPGATPAITAENGEGKDTGSSANSSDGGDQHRRGPFPAGFQARKAAAVTEAIETGARRHARRDGGLSKNGKPDKEAGTSNGSRGDGGGHGEGPTLTGALRHSGVSAMVNMHLSQAERALRTATATIATGGGGEGGPRGLPEAGGGDKNAGSHTKWVWSDTAAKARQGARVPGGWVEEEGAATLAAAAVPLGVAAAAAATAKLDANNNGNVTATPPAAQDAFTTEATAQGRDEAGTKGGRAENANEDVSAPAPAPPPAPAAVGPAAATAAPAPAAEPVPVGGAGCRRAVAALLDTLDAGSASAAADLSIAQWKVVSVVLLTAVGLGAGAVGQGAGDGDSGGAAPGAGAGAGVGGDVNAYGEAGVVGREEAAGGAEACLRLCGPEMSLSASEFRILVEVLLLDE